MKSSKQTLSIKTRVTSAIIGALFFLCALISFAFVIPHGGASADESVNKDQTANGIRFVQVAAGEDFAIGLTSDRKLYGWSLTRDPSETTLNTSATSLGEYYTATPREIEVVFRRGPELKNDGTVNSRYTFSDVQYHEVKSLSAGETVADEIKTIVATRTTAAFVTQKGFIYTWGYDNSKENVYLEEWKNNPHLLLLRMTEHNQANITYTPYIIDYNYYGSGSDGNNTPLNRLIPTSDFEIDIAASEYNYTVIFGNSNSNGVYHYTWGSLMYGISNIQAVSSYNSLSYEGGTDMNDATALSYMKGGIVRFVTQISSDNISNYTGNVVGGGYNVAVRGSDSSLYLRGRNFLTSQNVTVSGNTVSVTQTVSVGTSSNAEYKYVKDGTAYTVTNAVMGGKSGVSQRESGLIENGSGDEAFALSSYYGVMGGGNNSFIGNTNVEIYGAHDLTTGLIGTDTVGNGFGAVRYGVSLGNDVGYGISSAGSLYAWGDNAYGQLAQSSSTKNSNTSLQISISGAGKFVSVAAGKQLSGSVKAFNSYATLDSNSNAWNDAVLNEKEFITGALTESGALYVWSHESYQPKQITFGNVSSSNVQSSDQFQAVYSGYGNNLFAITKVGKLVRITVGKDETSGGAVTYSQEIYDNFVDAKGVAVTNWSINNISGRNVTNSVVFDPVAEPTRANPAPDFSSATFYVWNATPAADTNVKFNGNNGTYNALVTNNNIGDVYRILTEDSKTFLIDSGSVSEFAPKFYFDGVSVNNLMDAVQQENMFSVDIVHDENGEGIKITPHQSSRGKTITAVFYVARYNHTDNYTVNDGDGESIAASGSDNAIYYDYSECRIEFTISDTTSVVSYSAYGASGNSNIPLLDPNNRYNTYYSLAVQNVSEGVNKLIDYITAPQDSQTQSDVSLFLSNAITSMNGADLGFPASSKVQDGNLDYYLGSDVDKYTDVYQYLFTDRDADRVVVDERVVLSYLYDGNNNEVTGEIKHIDVTVTIPDNVVLNDENIEYLAKRFINVYGLYNIVVNTEGTNKTLSFTYDVLQIHAISGTGTIIYNSNSVSAYSTTITRNRAMVQLDVYTRPVQYSDAFTTYDVSYLMHAQDGVALANSGRTVQNVVGIYAQPSLRLKDIYTQSDDEEGNVIYGQGGQSYNEITIIYDKVLYVGSSETLNLSTFVGLDGANGKLSDTIRFSYNNSVTTYADFNKQFVDETGSGLSVVELNQTTLKIAPTTNKTIHMTVTVQRFTSNLYQNTFGDDEKVYLTFIFNNIQDFNLNSVSSVKEFIINQPSVINVFGKDIDNRAINGPYISIDGVDANSIANLSNYVSIVGLLTSEDNKSTGKLFTCSDPSGGAFEITPLASGSGSVQFIVNLYGKTVFISLTLHIASTTTLTDTVIVVDDQYLYVTDIKNKLDQSNSFNGTNDMSAYKILYNDIQNPDAVLIERVYNAIEFRTMDGTPANPPFVKNVVFEGADTSNPSIRIVSANTAVPGTETYYLCVTFVKGNAATYAEAQDADKLVVRIPVKSGKSVITDHMVNINCKAPTDNEFVSYNGTSGLETTAVINIAYLLNSIEVEGSPNYNVFLVSADSVTSTYFNYAPDASKKNVVITPLYNTPKDDNNIPIASEINVSVSNGTTFLVISFGVTVDGILTVLPVTSQDGTIGYGEIWLYSFIIVFGVLAIIFIIRIIVYWRRRAKQRAIIKRNQELIRMRDRMHNKANAASKEQIVRTKLKMEDPKYAKIFNEMRKEKENESGITLENSELAATADSKVKKNKKKKKGGKKTVAELKAELEAKKAAFAAAQANAQPVNPFETGVPMDGAEFVAPDDGFVAQDGFADPNNGFATPDIDGGEIIFDASDLGDGM